MANSGLNATLGKVSRNRGGKHGGISPSGGKDVGSAKPEGSSGNPGLAFPWEGADATPKSDKLPPLTHL